MARKLISFDWTIRKLLRSKANFGILEGFLSELLKFDVKILEVLESESNPDYHSDFNRVDLKVKDQQDNIIIVEVQYSYESDYLQRILFGVSKTITEHLEEGDPYDSAKGLLEAKEKLDLMKLPAEQRKAYESYQYD